MAQVRNYVKLWGTKDRERYSYQDGTALSISRGYSPHVSTRFIGATKELGSDSAADKPLPELYASRSECCGCSACAAICPKGAIRMEYDEEGFLYPVVDARLCIRCGACLNVCSFS